MTGSDADDILTRFEYNECLEMPLAHRPSLFWELGSKQLRVSDHYFDVVIVGSSIVVTMTSHQETSLVHRLLVLKVVESDGRHRGVGRLHVKRVKGSTR